MIRFARVARRPGWPLWAVGIVLLWAGMVAAIFATDRVRGTATPTCLFRHVTGVPCPTCGGTHAAFALAAGDAPRALAFNPLVTVMIPAMAGWGVMRVGAGRQLVLRPGACGRAVLWSLAAAAFMGNWAYVIHRTLAAG